MCTHIQRRIWGLLCAAGLLASARVSATPTPEYNVTITSQPLLAKHGLYTFTIRVRDRAGEPVQNARVSLRLHSFRSPGYRLEPARHVGHGRYRVTSHLHIGLETPRHVRAVVEAP